MKPKVLFSYILLCLIWGTTWIVLKKSLMDGTPPFFGSGIRFMIAGTILWMIILYKKKFPPFDPLAIRIYFQFGVLNLTISYGLTYWATQYIYSSISSIIWSGFPLTVAIFSYFMLPDEKMNQKKMFQVQERLDKTIVKEKDLLTRLSKLKQKKRNLAFKLHHLKYHQPVL